MTVFPRTLNLLAGAPLGIFGAGHLGRTVAGCLVDAGFPRTQLLVCHRGSQRTQEELAQAGLAGNIVDNLELVRRSGIIFYVVRPQDAGAITACPPPAGTLIVSFMAGISLARLRELIPGCCLMRVLTSAPDTLAQGRGIAAIFPGGKAVVDEILAAIRVRPYVLRREEDLHAFTVLGPCLPIALTCWEARGGAADDQSLLRLGTRHGLPGYRHLLQWAREVQPRGQSPDELAEYLTRSATRGGVTEAILDGIKTGKDLDASLEDGITRSVHLGRTVTTDQAEPTALQQLRETCGNHHDGQS